MSRAKVFNHNGEEYWFDYKNSRATAAQLELLADYEGVEIDDLLDEGLSQKAVARRLFEATSYAVPPHVLERRRERALIHGMSPACRICHPNRWECEGRITKHHFVPRWLMLELENYQAYSSRSLCTIPICVGQHRDLHLRDEAPKSIVPYLRKHEREFAHKMLTELKEQRPVIFDLIAAGDEHSYEYQLARDFQQGLLLREEDAYDHHEYGLDSARMLG